ncbi:hypothetical protein FACS189459_0270 [Bacilli bacterium]|nr:hypothetical protein FACS189459_0270 [Bacilli bacterium]
MKNNLDNLHTVLDNQQKIAAAHSTSMKYNYDNDDSLNKLQASIYYSTHNASDGVDYTVFLQ